MCPKFDIKFENTSDVAQSVTLLAPAEKASQRAYQDRFNLPYAVSYPVGSYFRAKIGLNYYDVTISESKTFLELVSILSSITSRNWQFVASSVLEGNILDCYSPEGCTELSLSIPPEFVSSSTTEDGLQIEVAFNKAMADPTGKEDEFSYKIDGDGNTFSGAALKTGDNTIIVLNCDVPVEYGEAILISFKRGTVVSADDDPLISFENYLVTNTVIAVSWNQLNSGTTESLYSVHFVNGNVGWAVGNNSTILKTSDGGANWTPQTAPFSILIYGLFAYDPLTAWVCGAFSNIFYTIEGGEGETWLNTNYPSANSLFSVFFIDALTGYLCGGGGIIGFSSDGGASWSPVESGTIQALTSIYFIDSNNGWCCGYGGTILTTIDGGVSWSAQTSGITEQLNKIFFINENIGYCCGENGLILKTTNAGESWSILTSGTLEHLKSIFFLNSNYGWACGTNGLILKTQNGGETWSVDPSEITDDLFSIFMISPELVFCCGASGKILKYS